MMGMFLGTYDKTEQMFMVEYLVLLEVSPAKSSFLLDKITTIFKGRNIDRQNTRFCCLDGTNSISGETAVLMFLHILCTLIADVIDWLCV